MARPPYDRFERLVLGSRAPGEPGTLLAIAVSDARAGAAELRGVVLEVRTRYPALPPVVWFRGSIGGDTLRLARRLGALHVRGVVVGAEPIDPALRGSLSRPARLGTEVTEWLGVRGVAVAPAARSFIRACFAKAPAPVRLADVTANRLPARTLRARFAAAHLPGPGAWVSLARGVRTALALQARPRISLLQTALELRYGDHGALSRHLKRLFGLRPTEIRARLGWEWLLDRWLRSRA